MEMRCGGWSWGLRVSLSDPASSLTLSELLQRPQVTLFPYLAKITAKRHRSAPSYRRGAAVIELKLQGDEDKWCLRLETHPGGLISPQWIGEMTFRRLSVWNHNNNNPFSDRTQKGKLRTISIYGGLIMVHQYQIEKCVLGGGEREGEEGEGANRPIRSYISSCLLCSSNLMQLSFRKVGEHL